MFHKTLLITLIIRKRREDDLKSKVNLGLEGGVEASEGIVGGCVVGTLLLDIVLVVLLANFVDTEENVDHAHLCVVEYSGDGEFRKENRERNGRAVASFSPFLPRIVPLSLVTTRLRENGGLTVETASNKQGDVAGNVSITILLP